MIGLPSFPITFTVDASTLTIWVLWVHAKWHWSFQIMSMTIFNVWSNSTISKSHNLFFKDSIVSADDLVPLAARKYTGTIKAIRVLYMYGRHVKCRYDVSFFIATNSLCPLGVYDFNHRHVATGDVCFKHLPKCCLCYIRVKTYDGNVHIQHLRLLDLFRTSDAYMRR